MKQFIKKCCCIYISALFSINTLILAYAQPFYENSYVNSYDTQCMIKDDKNILDIIKYKTAIIVLNKSDLKEENKNNEELINSLYKPVVRISAINGEGLDNLYDKISELFEFNEISNSNELLITNERHKNQIKKAKESIKNAIKTIKEQMPLDIITIYIKQALEDLGEITGDNVSEDIINEIFSKFCLGK